ncbi:MAG: hypothetical protein U0074_24495 [Kouleothrix sp.]
MAGPQLAANLGEDYLMAMRCAGAIILLARTVSLRWCALLFLVARSVEQVYLMRALPCSASLNTSLWLLKWIMAWFFAAPLVTCSASPV